jgi:hypothetical protein
MNISKVHKIVAPLILMLALIGTSLLADNYSKNESSAASIKILSPADKARIDAGEEYALKYEVTPGPGGDHFHVWVDDTRGPGVHDAKGTYMLPKMTPGTHTITIKVVDKGHVPTGPQKSITVIAQ